MSTHMSAPRAPIYWIGGSPCAGKSTVAQVLADRYNLHYYQCDAWFPEHQRRASPVQAPTLHRLASLSRDEIWLPPVAEHVAWVQAIYGEEFALILADLHALPSEQPLYAVRYIIKLAQGAKQGEVGTGGTPFTVYLKKHIQETKNHLL